MQEKLFCSTHHSLLIAPWETLPGGVRVVQVDDPNQIVLLIRNRQEMNSLIDSLWEALYISERR